MKPRERVLATLRGELPDRVPWVEMFVEDGTLVKLMGQRDEYPPDDLCDLVGLDGCSMNFRTSITRPEVQLTPGYQKHVYNQPKSPTTRFIPPWIVEHGEKDGRAFIKRGLLQEPADLKLFDEYLPDPDHPLRYERVQNWLARYYKGNYASAALVHAGTEASIESMGLVTAALAVYDNPEFLRAVAWRYAEWCARVIEHVNELDVDLVFVLNDHGDNNGPWFSPDVFRDIFLPPMREVTRRIKKPWIYHSDGNIERLLPDLLPLGMHAIHPVQPGAMDLAKTKQEWGGQVCLAAGLDLVHTLTRATPLEVDRIIRGVIATAAPGGRFILSSITLTDYCRPENILAAGAALRKYGQYPLAV